MCGPDQRSDDSTPSAMKAESDLSSSDGSESNESANGTNHESRKRETHQSAGTNTNSDNDTFVIKESSLLWSVLSGHFNGILWCIAALTIAFNMMSREKVEKIYKLASFEYDPEISVFDNTILTWGTDYALSVITGAFAIWIRQTSKRSSRDDIRRLALASTTMLFLYSIQTLAGAIAHQTFLTVESRNSLTFRLLWTLCVGLVYLASAPMGMIGSECLKIFQPRSNCSAILKTMPYLTNAFWLMYGVTGTFAYAKGFLSFQRPAADIFIAGVTQTPTTFYFMAFLYLVEQRGITNFMKVYGLVGFILNAYLFFIFPFLVIDLGWSLGVTNLFCHVNLCIAWSLQGLILQRLVKSLVEEDETKQKELRQKKVQ